MSTAAAEKVYVALPAEFKAGRPTLSWALSHFGGGGSTMVVITHVHVPSRTIPVLGGKFHASKVSPDQVAVFRWVEREKVNEMLNDYVHQCSEMKVKCEKLIVEKDDVVAGLVDLIALHGVTKLVISGAADRQYSRKMDRPKSKTAMGIMQRADPSCKIWFVCKGQLICTRDSAVKIAPAGSPSVPDFSHPSTLKLTPVQEEEEYAEEEGDIVLELGLYAEMEEACVAAASLMRRALNESSRRRKADEELVSALQKAEEYRDLYLEEARKRQELEAALARANREIAQLREDRSTDLSPQDGRRTTTDAVQLQAETAEASPAVDVNAGLLGSGPAAAGELVIELREEEEEEEGCVQMKLGRDDCGAGESQQPLLLLGRRNQAIASLSPSSVIRLPYDDEDCGAPSYFLCLPVLQEVMRGPHAAADGFSYGAIRGRWLEAGREVSVSPAVTGQPPAQRELDSNFALRGVVQDDYCIIRRQRRQQQQRF